MATATSSSSQASVIKVSSAAQLITVLKTVKAGQTIELAKGNYGDVNMRNLKGVTITSQDASNPATFNSINMTNSSDMKIHHVQMNVGHYGVFNGSRFRAQVVPRIVEFARRIDDR